MMTMLNKESAGDYAKRFQLAMYNAGLPWDCPRVADRFLASLTKPVQTLIRVTLARAGLSGTAAEKYTVDQITQVGRDILGDDHSTYYDAVSLFPGAPREQHYERGSRRDKANDSKQVQALHRTNKSGKSYFCVQHGKNGTHGTIDCFSLKKRGDRPPVEKKKSKECWKCGQAPWHSKHQCAEKSNTVLAVSKVSNTEKSIEEQVEFKLIMSKCAEAKDTKTPLCNVFNLKDLYIWQNIIQEFLWPTCTSEDIIYALKTMDYHNIFYCQVPNITVRSIIYITLAEIWKAHFRLVFQDAPLVLSQVLGSIRQEIKKLRAENTLSTRK
jgi:hypothetical protein